MRNPRSATLLALILAAGPAVADPPDPLDLARGLRDAGLADLAVEYLAGPAAAGRPDLPLERALALLAEADAATDDAARDALVARARADLDQFQRTGGRGRPEAAVAAARADALAARSRLGRAARVKDDAAYKAAAATARGPLAAAATALGRAADKLDQQTRDGNLTPAREQQLTRELARTRLDEALTRYQVTRTFAAPTAAEVVARADAAKAARTLFDTLAKTDRFTDLPVRAVAKAWAGQCSVVLDDRAAAEKVFDEVKKDSTPVAAAGRRMARYFEVRLKVEDATNKGGSAATQAAKAVAAGWLRDYDAARPTAEGLAVRYQLALLKQREATAQVREDPATKKPVVPPAALALLKDAERDYRRLTETDNEYADRAADKRAEVARLIVGDADPDPVKLSTFDEAAMAAAVVFDRALRDPGDGRAGKLAAAVALLERAAALPAESAREVTDVRVRLAFAYLLSDRPADAAALGEQVARAGGGVSAARAGSYAVRGYLAAAAKLPPGDPGRAAVQQKAVDLAKHLDRTFPADPATDDARIVLGQLLAKDGKPREAFDLLSRVGPTHPRAAVARLMEGSAAFELLRPADGKPAGDRAEVIRRLAADVQSVPKPTAETPAADAEAFVRMLLLLAQVYLTDAPAGFPKAEQTAANAASTLKSLPQVGGDERQALGFGIEETRLRAVYGQMAPQVRAGKAAVRLDKLTAEIAAAGPAVKPGQEAQVAAAAKRLDDFRRNEVIVLALKASIREKAVEKAGTLFDLLKQLGGSVDASVQAVAQLTAGVRPDIDALRREGKADEAAALVSGVGDLLDKVIREPGLTAGQRVYLGRALKELGSFEKAVEVLKAVPAPPADQLAKSPNDLQGDAKTAALLYRGALLELAETYRLAKDFAAADEVLKPATDPKTGWAKSAPNFRREALMLTEAKAAAAADPAAAQKLWVEALTGWNALAGEYRAMLVRPLPAVPPAPKPPPADAPEAVRKKYEADVAARADAEQKQADARRQKETVVKPLYFDAFYEVQRCVVRGNTLLLKADPEKLGRSLDKVADSIRKVEESNPDLRDDLRAKFAELLAESPDLRQRYEAKGGKALLKPADPMR